MPVPVDRVLVLNQAPADPRGRYVLYWMIAARRTRSSFGLDHALARARELKRPLLVFEPLRVGYRWACVRFHRFVIEGMAGQARRFSAGSVGYFPYVEPTPGAGQGLLEALAREAACVVTDDSPAFFLPSMVEAAAPRLPVRLEAVDGNGILPLRRAPRAFPTAHAFRRFLQCELGGALLERPSADPLESAPGRPLGARGAPAGVSKQVLARWPAADLEALQAPGGLRFLPIDQGVAGQVAPGGEDEARARLAAFVAKDLDRYDQARNQLEDGAESRLSPYLHFGHLGSHQAVESVLAAGDWSPDRLDPGVRGARQGFWGLGPGPEAFLDQLITWRELGFNFAALRGEEQDRFDSLPDWALRTLASHATDPRPVTYDLDTLAEARTHDRIWNAAQLELREEGRIQNYLRMLWGKKILEWSPTPRRAAEVMIELNNRYALDGRDPNSYAGIFWVLGRFDRAWGPERPIFGTVRYMSSDCTARKLRLKAYLTRWGQG